MPGFTGVSHGASMARTARECAGILALNCQDSPGFSPRIRAVWAILVPMLATRSRESPGISAPGTPDSPLRESGPTSLVKLLMAGRDLSLKHYKLTTTQWDLADKLVSELKVRYVVIQTLIS
jgi:hypothetical protein